MTNKVSFLAKIDGEIGLSCLALLTTPTPWTAVTSRLAVAVTRRDVDASFLFIL